MNPNQAPWQDSLAVGWNYTIAQFSTFLPKLVGAAIVLLGGIIVAKIFRRLVIKTLSTFRVSRIVEKTPLELFLKNAEVGEKIEEIIAGIFYWLFLFLTVYTAVSILELAPLSLVFEKILGYIPHIFSAFFIFIFGVLLAGMVETLVKGTLKSLDAHSARLFAKVASYLVVSVAALAAIAELGIASQFITILFMGVVGAFTIGVGLAVGLGGQDTVRKILDNWYKRTRE
jgi:hypothetical protein